MCQKNPAPGEKLQQIPDFLQVAGVSSVTRMRASRFNKCRSFRIGHQS
jgi:hypothetical protein